MVVAVFPGAVKSGNLIIKAKWVLVQNAKINFLHGPDAISMGSVTIVHVPILNLYGREHNKKY